MVPGHCDRFPDFEKYPCRTQTKNQEAIRELHMHARCICNLQWDSRRGVDIYRQAGVKEEREQR